MPKDISSDVILKSSGLHTVEMPSGEFVSNASYSRDGADLHLTSADGQTVTVEGYFANGAPPDLITADGARLSPELVNDFLPPQHIGQYAAAGNTSSDASPAGQVSEVVGDATIMRADGTSFKAEVGTVILAGDVIETKGDGAVNITFADNTTFALSDNARFAVKDYAYNAESHQGETFFSMLQGTFVYASGLIGKTNHDNVHIETPVGSIGIRGTIVAGDINPAGQASNITLVQGAIIVRNAGGEVSMTSSMQNATINSFNDNNIQVNTISPQQFNGMFGTVSAVTETVFSNVQSGSYSVNAPAAGQGNGNAVEDANTPPAAADGQAVPQGAGQDGTAPPAGVAPQGSDAPVPPTDAPQKNDVRGDAPVDAPPPPTANLQQVMMKVAIAADAPPPGSFNSGGNVGTLSTGPAAGTGFGGVGNAGSQAGAGGAAAGQGGVGGSTQGPLGGGIAGFGPAGGPNGPLGGPNLNGPNGTNTGNTATGSLGNNFGGTGTNSGGAAVVPDVKFIFAPFYTKGTPAITSDDGIPLFGYGLPLNVEIGRANVTNVPAGAIDHFELSYRHPVYTGGTFATLTTSGAISGYAYGPNTGTSGGLDDYDTQVSAALVPVFNFDSTTGAISVANQFGLEQLLNGQFQFTLVAKSTNNTIIGVPQSFVFQLEGLAGQLFFQGTPNSDGDVTTGTFPDGSGGVILNAAGNALVFTGDGDDRVEIPVGTVAPNRIFTGTGDDLVVIADPDFGHIDMGAGNNDRIIIKDFNLDFTTTTGSFKNIEVIELFKPSAPFDAPDITLNLNKIFEMTGPSNTLTIKTSEQSDIGRLFIDLDQLTYVSGTLLNDMSAPGLTGDPLGTGNLMYQATQGGRTITLVIDQGNTVGGVTVTDI